MCIGSEALDTAVFCSSIEEWMGAMLKGKTAGNFCCWHGVLDALHMRHASSFQACANVRYNSMWYNSDISRSLYSEQDFDFQFWETDEVRVSAQSRSLASSESRSPMYEL